MIFSWPFLFVDKIARQKSVICHAKIIRFLLFNEISRFYRANSQVAGENVGRVSWFSDFIGRFSRATKQRPQKSADFILTFP